MCAFALDSYSSFGCVDRSYYLLGWLEMSVSVIVSDYYKYLHGCPVFRLPSKLWGNHLPKATNLVAFC